jgi:hypothetical protein
VVYSDGTDEFTVPGYISGNNITISPDVNTSYSLLSVTDAGSNTGSGNSGTPDIFVTMVPKLSVSIGDFVVNANNDGIDDKGSFSVCNMPNNILTGAITDQNGSIDPLLKFQQTYSPVNVNALLCISCTSALPFFSQPFTASLVDPSLPGSMTLRWRPWVDANNDNIVDASECAGDWIEIIITVNPNPTAVATPSTQSICSGNSITSIGLSGSGTTFNWTRDNAASVTGIAASGDGDINGSLTNTTSAPVMVTFTITPTANNCTGTPITATVLVNPTANVVALPSSQTICSAATITAIELSGTVGGTIYNWTRDNTASVTGIAASGAGDISGALTNSTPTPVTVTFTISPTANNCPGSSVTATVIVNPEPMITCPADLVVNNTTGLCSGVATYTASATGIPTPALSYTFTGATVRSGSGTGSGQIFNVGMTTVTLTATNSCGSSSCSFTVTVKDIQAPVINQIAKPIVLLWSPSHSYQTISASQFITSVSDNCGTVPVGNVVITKVTSDEAEDAAGDDGNTLRDIVIAANCKSVQLRSERMGGGNGRVYTIYVAVKDVNGNTATATFKVYVSASQKGTTAVDNIVPLYTVNSSCSGIASKTAKMISSTNEDSGEPTIQTYPNPFSSSATVYYTLSNDAHIHLAVYNQLGQKVAVLQEGKMSAGRHYQKLDGTKLAAGFYICRLVTRNAAGKSFQVNEKLIITK